jgi:pimeloyl-ACP methyl ester carboxylesterase
MAEVAAQLEPVRLEANGFVFSGLAAGPSEGPLVLLLHGWPEFSSSWSEMVRSLGSDGYRAVAIDQRGYSEGARPPEISDYSIGKLVRDVLAFGDALGRQRFHIVSHDWGALVGWHVAASHPDRLATFTTFARPVPTTPIKSGAPPTSTSSALRATLPRKR